MWRELIERQCVTWKEGKEFLVGGNGKHALGESESRYGSLVRKFVTWVMVIRWYLLWMEVRWRGVGVEEVEEVLMEEVSKC